ncbi:MAG: ribbon-helix-helix domain-containing protein [Nanoarchaeota archaeon]|nr:ribbon-helix-helix domain-containing protein [Nanoarchaeota archaeon]
MAIKTLPVNLQEETILEIDKIAKAELSSRTRILRLAIREYLENQNGK